MVDWIVWFLQLRIVSVVIMFWCGWESGRVFEVRKLLGKYEDLIEWSRQLDQYSEALSWRDRESDCAA